MEEEHPVLRPGKLLKCHNHDFRGYPGLIEDVSAKVQWDAVYVCGVHEKAEYGSLGL